MGKKYRIERDSLGEIKILEENLWGVTTERALKFFNISKEKFPKEMIRAYGIIKKSCALANFKLNMLGNYEKELIVKICNEIIKGKFDKEFPLNIWISGSGTQFNMNFNEVISNYASVLEGYPKGSKIPLHPNDHVNCSQSTNDTFPSAMSIAFYIKAKEELLPELLELQLILEKKAVEFFPIKKIGRTHMQDAVPMQLGEEFLNYSILIKENIFRIEKALEELLYLPIGGTAVGNGINAPKNFSDYVIKEIIGQTGYFFKESINKFAYQGSHDNFLNFSGTLKTLSNSVYKIANDIRLLSSGPRSGLNELVLPENEPGSSIMPGKINPTQCEILSMIALQVIGNDFVVTLGGSGGFLELNVYKPLIMRNTLESIELLKEGCKSFRKYLLKNIKPNLISLEENLKNSLMIGTYFVKYIGYDKVSKLILYAQRENISLEEANNRLKLIEKELFNSILYEVIL